MTFLLAIILLLGMPVLSEAATTLTADSCSYADVLTKVTAAVHGDTVQVPVGTCTWTSTLAFTNKSITIKGAGRSSTRAQCTPSQTTYTCILSVNPIIDWTTVDAGNTPTGLSVLRDFTFDSPGASSGTCSTYGLASLIFEGFSKNIRITNNTIIYEACWGISVKKPYGVIDHNKFISYKGAKHGLHVLYTGSTTNFIYGDESWSRASSLGSEVNVFVEDNTFESDPSVLVVAPSEGSYFTDHFLGGRIVHRFNTITDGNFAQHGTESGGRGRGFREHETYRNNWVWTSSSTTATLTGFRGGTGRLFENTATGLMSRFAGFSTYRAGPIPGDTNGYPWALCQRQTATSVTSSGTTATVVVPSNHGIAPPTSTAKAYMTISDASPSGYNGVAVKATRVDATTFTYQVAAGLATPATGTILVMGAFDGNTDSKGYPCLDQVGYGKSVLLAGNGPDVAPDVTPAGWPTQGLEPVYCFKNLVAGALNACAAATAGSDVIVSLRDFYNQHASFDGVTNHGIGYGTRASRPASCTTGDAWWATNDATNWNISTTETYSANISGLSSGADGALDICTATNTWTDTTNATCTGLNCYVPYTYPHPLVQGDAPPAPTNPTGVRVIGTTTATSGTLVWTPSTASDFKSYRIYHGLASGSYTLPTVTITKASAVAAHTPLAQHTFQSTLAGTHYFVVTEVNTQDLESAVSSEVSVALTGLSRAQASTRSPRP